MMGRKSKYTPEIIKQIAGYIADGYTQKDAARNVGITTSTFHEWMNKYDEFSRAIKNAHHKKLSSNLQQNPSIEPTIFRKTNPNKRHSTQYPSKKGGYVYIVRHSDSNYYKIGRSSTKWSHRKSQLQTGNPLPLIDVAVLYLDDYPELEYDLHVALDSTRRQGEWFELDEDDVSDVIEYACNNYGIALA